MSLQEFSKYKKYFDSNIDNILSNYVNSHNIKEMINYSLEGGKRLRPIISLDICNTLCNDRDKALKFALAIELIHNSSLIIDDLPCMDNDDFRRGKLSFHKKYSDTLAQLVARELLNISINLIIDSFKNEKLDIILHILSRNLGIMGAATGQLIDVTPLTMYSNKKEIINSISNKEELKKLFKKKTTSFFEIAFLGGYLLGEGDINFIDQIQEASDNFGIAFQIYDDFDDIEQDKKRKDLNLIDPNFINNFGQDEALSEFNKCIETFKYISSEYNIKSNITCELCSFLESKVKSKLKNI